MVSRLERRIGLLGGTFDPPHIGHVVVGVWAHHMLALDEVRLVVANDPWQKTRASTVTPAGVRLSMVEAAVAGIEGLVASAMEIERGGSSYMVETLEALHEREPDADLFVILGADAAAGLPTWHRWEDLPALATFVLVDRPGALARTSETPFAFEHLEVPRLDVTSTLLRSLVGRGAPVDGLVPAPVSSLIRERGLYRGEVHERPTAL